ncbi:MAG: rsmB [Nocardia sp.]|nr:rsmB [Nocardia sp.]
MTRPDRGEATGDDRRDKPATGQSRGPRKDTARTGNDRSRNNTGARPATGDRRRGDSADSGRPRKAADSGDSRTGSSAGRPAGSDRRDAKPAAKLPRRDWRPKSDTARTANADSRKNTSGRDDSGRPRSSVDGRESRPARTGSTGAPTTGGRAADARGPRTSAGRSAPVGQRSTGRDRSEAAHTGSVRSEDARGAGKGGTAGADQRESAAPQGDQRRSESADSAAQRAGRSTSAVGQRSSSGDRSEPARNDSARKNDVRGPGKGGPGSDSADQRESAGAQSDQRRSSGSAGRGNDSRGRGAAAKGDSKRTTAAGKHGDRGDRGAEAAQGLDAVRVVARDVLRAVRERDAYANLVLPGLLRERKISGRDAALATELTYGSARSLGLLDAVIAAGAGRPVDEIDGPLLDALRLGAYQLLRTRIGAHAAVDTSVALVRAEFGIGRAGFVNAVLRRVAERSAEQWVEALAPKDPLGHMAFEFAHPVWIAQAFADALGERAGELREVLAADDARPIVHLVARPGEMSAEELALVTGGEEGRWSPYAVYLDSGDPGKLEPVRDGLAGVQDEGSQLVALALTRAPLDGPDGGRWLDLCAGPGGKAALLGAIADIDGHRIDAVEPAEHRAELVRQSTRGLPVDIHIADGRDSGLTPGYDRVLVDAPCTGLGALRRRPEARWRRQPSDVGDLVKLQRELLSAAWDLVRPGGVVVYSTCSPHLAETVSVVSDMVRRTGAEQLDSRELLPGVPDLGDGLAAQLWPHRHGTDAMFVAALRKPLE